MAAAADLYRQAVSGIESVRAGIRRSSLRSEFLADKREVYDSLIALELRKAGPSPGALFSLMERSRARAFEERSQTAPQKEPSLSELQAALPADTVMIEFWAGSTGTAALWFTSSSAGAVQEDSAQPLESDVAGFARALQSGGEGWRTLSRDLGKRVLAGIPAAKHMIAVPDGVFSALPLEALTAPHSGRLVVEDCDVSYVPAARFLVQRKHGNGRPLPPWRIQLLAYGDPPLSGTDVLGREERWQPIPAAADEVRSIARELPGTSQVLLGSAAKKHDLLSRRLEGISLLHFSTHAIVDAENSDRSRILMASDSPAAPLDYLFQQEIYGLNLKGVDLATISACEGARGPIVRGDGVRAFSQAFLSAGASATVTSLWQVADRPTAEFMQQFYYFLAAGQPKAVALRSAKLRFLDSHSGWSAPRYWSAFVLNGDGWNPITRVIPWSWLFAAAGAAMVIAVLWVKAAS
jgi:hypothetical protein